MGKNFLITVLLFLFSSNAIAARFVCIADNQFTGRGNINERMLTITKPANKKLSSLTIDMRGCSSISDVVRIKIYSSLTNKLMFMQYRIMRNFAMFYLKSRDLQYVNSRKKRH
jgi:hypothetical protein